MSAALHIPRCLKATTPEALQRLILQAQVAAGGKFGIIAMYWDGKNHVCWYMPLSQGGAP